ncbi:hypothetical protein [Paraburkholderia hayleyella]|uniref:hypothetical protein n=1 Tax=Paraburkholderia hayleyella TaxID=2152889 RepID=UPI001292BAE2|nr:hypothetical protein [Paraburkholderia hayleyella]
MPSVRTTTRATASATGAGNDDKTKCENELTVRAFHEGVDFLRVLGNFFKDKNATLGELPDLITGRVQLHK